MVINGLNTDAKPILPLFFLVYCNVVKYSANKSKDDADK
jgi:hypothetical protein